MRYCDLIQFEAVDAEVLRDETASLGGAPRPAETRSVPEQTNDLQELVVNRMLRKTLEQRAAIRDYLAPFARFYGNMTARIEEFVDTFPLHPDYLAVVGKIRQVQPEEVLNTITKAVRELLHQNVPSGTPGLVGYDSYWLELAANPRLRSLHEIEAVTEYNKLVARRIATIPRPELRDMALRLVHALSVQRLTTEDVYAAEGPTAAELRDGLCLHLPGVEEMGGDPADALLLHVIGVLDVMVHKSLQKQFMSFEPETGQYFLHLRRFKRFVLPELALHWVNGIPFLVLLATGGAMLCTRLLHLDNSGLDLVITIHKVAAACWAILVPLTIILRPKVHWQHIRPMLKWGAGDAVWMLQSVRSLIDKKAEVPPAGRFNTGQKINACLVMLYFVVFTVTGSSMIWHGSALFPWYVHTFFFLSAMGSVGGHLYLALINPSTRIALAGIFHGWAPIRYVEHHHFLSLPHSLRRHSAHGHPHGDLTLYAVMKALVPGRIQLAVLCAGLLGGAVMVFLNLSGMASAQRVFAKSVSESIKPRELSSKHRGGPTGQSCAACHTYAGGIPDAKCEECHKEVANRRASRVGYHGTLEGDCIECHKEHPEASQPLIRFDTNKFDHKLAAFPREGKHAQVACDECHLKKRQRGAPGSYYIGIKHDTCTDCHRDQHSGQLGQDCVKCHNPNGWKGKALTLSHNVNTSYKLEGKHLTTSCGKCHNPETKEDSLSSAVFKGLPQKCVGCHQEPHRGQFQQECDSCHSPSGWDRQHLKFEHNTDSRFPLVEKHAGVSCEKCHSPTRPGERLGFAQFRGLKTECADCHKDPHRGQLGQDCTRCHQTPVDWSVAKARLQHNLDTKYPLSGKHLAVDCIKCHKPETPGGPLGSARFKGLGTTCESCHQPKQPPHYGPSCTSCHTLAGWPKKNPGLEHIFNYRINGQHLNGKHLTAKCDSCHDGVRIGPLATSHRAEYQCITCHEKDDPHKAALGTECFKCHSTEGWKRPDLLFDHNRMASFSLDQDHRKLACEKCHEDGQWKPLDSKCQSCHTAVFLDERK